jgi:hypothetical protein
MTIRGLTIGKAGRRHTRKALNWYYVPRLRELRATQKGERDITLRLYRDWEGKGCKEIFHWDQDSLKLKHPFPPLARGAKEVL